MTRPVPQVLDEPGRSAAGRVVRPLRWHGLAALDAAVTRPTYDPAGLRHGVVHLGVGAFHRAHQGVYFDRLAQQGVTDWAVVGVGLRNATHQRELLGQGCLYTVLELDAEPRAHVVGTLRDYLALRHQPRAVDAVLVDPATRLVTLTLTAPAYGGPGRTTAFDLIARALGDRRRAGVPPFTVLSCDNLPRNGDVTRRCVVEAAERRDPALARWIEAWVAFPNCMADRITPPVDTRHQRLLGRRFGINDRAPVATERFTQWIVEDAFCGERPPLEDVGVRFVADVGPFVEMKMRMLNAAHVALGYLGTGTPHATTADAMDDQGLGGLVEHMLSHEVEPVLGAVPGLASADYRADVMARLRNPAVADPLARLRRRGSVRVRNYVLPSLDAAVAAGRPHAVLTSVVAAWILDLHRCAEQVAAGTTSIARVVKELEDPGAERLLPHALRAEHDVRPLLAAADGFERLRRHRRFVGTLQAALTAQRGPTRAVS